MKTSKKKNRTAGLVVKLFKPTIQVEQPSSTSSHKLSRTATWRKKVKEKDKIKYEEMLKRDRERQREKWQRQKEDTTCSGKDAARLRREKATARQRLYRAQKHCATLPQAQESQEFQVVAITKESRKDYMRQYMKQYMKKRRQNMKAQKDNGSLKLEVNGEGEDSTSDMPLDLSTRHKPSL